MAQPPPPTTPVIPGSEEDRQIIVSGQFEANQRFNSIPLIDLFGTPEDGTAEKVQDWKNLNEEGFRTGPFDMYIFLVEEYLQ